MDFKRHTCKVIITLIIATCLVSGCEKIPTSGIPVVQATLDTPPIGVGEVGNISVSEDGTDILGKLIMIHETVFWKHFMTPFWSCKLALRSQIVTRHPRQTDYDSRNWGHFPNESACASSEHADGYEYGNRTTALPSAGDTPTLPRQHANDDTHNPTGRRCQNRLWLDRANEIIPRCRSDLLVAISLNGRSGSQSHMFYISPASLNA